MEKLVEEVSLRWECAEGEVAGSGDGPIGVGVRGAPGVWPDQVDESVHERAGV